jgi:signal transduction histidine kinase
MNPESWLATRSGVLSAWLAAFVCAGVLALAWVAHYAADEWTRASSQLVEQRALEAADLVVTALARDMRAAQVSLLDGRDWDSDSLRTPYLMNEAVQSALARYPYPAVFFAWHLEAPAPTFFARSDRRPTWLPDNEEEVTFPIEILSSPADADPLFARLRADMGARQEYSLFDIAIGGNRYQVVSRLHYEESSREPAVGAFGFLVDLDWVRVHYFPAITQQLTRIAHASEGIDCTLLDERGETVVGPAVASSPRAITRELPVLFFDDAIITGGAPNDLQVPTWSVLVSSDRDPTLALAARGARRTLIIVAAGALALGLGLVVTARASRAAAAISAMRSDFVAAVTHAFKTPVSVIRGVGETMLRGRVQTPDKQREYASLLVQEGYRLSRLVDNMLAYARITDGANVYQFETHDASGIVDEVLRAFQRLLSEGQFETTVDIDPALPPVRVDRTAFLLALDNLVDNAIRYSGSSRTLVVRAARERQGVAFSVIDQGPGIESEVLGHVQGRFTRGRTSGHGSGIGLAIAHRIARDHGGSLRLESSPGVGTTATIIVPVAISATSTGQA